LIDNSSQILLNLEKCCFKLLTEEYILLTNVPFKNEDEGYVNSDEGPNFQQNLMNEDGPVSEGSDM
jgi:hypothetical protein